MQVASAHQVNFYAANPFDEGAVVGACKVAKERGIGWFTAVPKMLDKVWGWLENSSVRIAVQLDLTRELFPPEQVFKDIKAQFKGGANAVEIALPPRFYKQSDDAVREFYDIVADAAEGHSFKVSIEPSAMSTPELRAAVKLAFEAKIPCVKLASGLYPAAATLPNLNAALEVLSENNCGDGLSLIDFTSDKSSDKFVHEDAFRLASRLGLSDNLIVSLLWK